MSASLDGAKVGLYGLVGPANDRLVGAKVTMYAVVRPTGAIPGPERRRRVAVSSQIVYRADS